MTVEAAAAEVLGFFGGGIVGVLDGDGGVIDSRGVRHGRHRGREVVSMLVVGGLRGDYVTLAIVGGRRSIIVRRAAVRVVVALVRIQLLLLLLLLLWLVMGLEVLGVLGPLLVANVRVGGASRHLRVLPLCTGLGRWWGGVFVELLQQVGLWLLTLVGVVVGDYCTSLLGFRRKQVLDDNILVDGYFFVASGSMEVLFMGRGSTGSRRV